MTRSNFFKVILLPYTIEFKNIVRNKKISKSQQGEIHSVGNLMEHYPDLQWKRRI